MEKLVTLNLFKGSIEQGFSVFLQIGEDGTLPSMQIEGDLPPAPELIKLYNNWQDTYCNLPSNTRKAANTANTTVQPSNNRIKAAKDIVKNVTIRNISDDFLCRFNSWLNDSPKFRPIKEKLLSELHRQEEIRFLLQTKDKRLWRFPWHLWDFFENYPKAEVALSYPEFNNIERDLSVKSRNKFRILAILGDSTGIDLDIDRKLLENLPNAEVIFIVEPKLKQLHEYLSDKEGWDILFFAGHSRTMLGIGEIDINQTESLTIEQLRYALKKAIKRGLKLAIFNSCDALGIAWQLADLQIPQIIVMREPVPDKVAQEFLKNFMYTFSQGNPLYIAVREAREQLEGLQNDFPYATWLPVICQHPAEKPIKWNFSSNSGTILQSLNNLRSSHVKTRSKILHYNKFTFLTIAGVLSLAVVWAIAKIGFTPSVKDSPILSTSISSTPEKNAEPQTTKTQISSVQARMSLGEKILVTADTNADKEAGVKAFATGDFATAVSKFQASLKKNQNDPEALIYLNNAKIGKSRSLKIASVFGIGGNLGISKESLSGVAQAQDEINHNGGINGIPLQILIANDDLDVSVGKQLASELVKDSNILAVVGHSRNEVTLAAAKIYNQSGLVMIAQTWPAQQNEIGKYIFRSNLYGSGTVLSDLLGRYIVKKARIQNIVVCRDSSSSTSKTTTRLYADAVSKAGGKIINTACDFAASDFQPTRIISRAISDGAEGLILAPRVDKIRLAINLARANKGRLELFAFSGLYTPEILQLGQSDINGMVLPVSWHPDAFPGNPFPEKAAKLWGTQKITARSANNYDALQIIIAGLKNGNYTRDGLQKALSNPNFSTSGATGTIQFLPNRDRKGTPFLIKVEPSQVSDTGYDFVLVE